jgi:hypothetical protein
MKTNDVSDYFHRENSGTYAAKGLYRQDSLYYGS